MVLALSTEAAERGSNRTRKDRCLVAVLSLLPAVIFLWLSTVRLDAQGLYYDELHQAAGAFAGRSEASAARFHSDAPKPGEIVLL